MASVPTCTAMEEADNVYSALGEQKGVDSDVLIG